jgi:arylsulfatase A-like enzyme
VIFVIADHGEEFNEHGGFWHGTTLYDEVLHVPLLIKTAKDQPKNIRVPWQVRSIDLAPTITDIFGVEADASWEGETLLSNVEQVEKFGNLEPCQVHPLERIAVSENDFEGNILSSIRMHNWKYILANEANPRGLGVEELYNLLADAQEKNNQVTVSSSNCYTDLPKQVQTWKMALGEMISIAQSSAAKSTAGELDEATIERMRALGYME